MLLRTTLAMGLLAISGNAQGVNCTLLGQLDPHGTYNDIWGYAAPNGDEYALVGVTNGTSIVDVTNPTAPVERAFIPGANSSWRDIRTYGDRAYVVTEGDAGMQVISLTNPNSPFLIGVTGANEFGNAHNICIDTATGRIYIVGAGGGAGNPVFDASLNPDNPPLVGNALPAAAGNPNSTYFHDIQVENGFAYGAMIYNGEMRIMNTSTLPLPIESNIGTPGNFTHNCWPNAAGTICVTTDEVTGGLIKFFDISNKAAPVPLGQFTPNSASIVHNAFIVGNYCHVSWYTEGYRCIDISDPNNPVEVASYDTWPASSTGFNGAWGVYPFLPSGNVLINDISTGLYIVRPDLTDLQIAHTPLGDTFDEINPYPVTCSVTSSNPITSVALTYSVGGGASTTVVMTPTGTPDEYSASIPAQLAPTQIAYHINAIDTVSARRNPTGGDHTFFVGSVTQVFFDDVETDLGWTHGLVSNQDDWQRGTPNGASGTSGGAGWQDPPGAFSGSFVWGNDLAPSGFNGAYQNNTSNWLQSPTIPTGGVQGLHFRYRRWITLANGDQGRVLVNGNLIATVPANTRDTSWQWIDHDISAIANSAANLTLRFELVTNGNQVAGGWNLDDFEIYVESDCVPADFYGSGTAGTSFVTPNINRSGPPRLGSVSNITASGMLGGTTCFLVLGLAPANTPVFGITGLVDQATSVFSFAATGGFPGFGGTGSASFPLAVPNNPVFDNIDLYNQIVVFDAGGPGGTFAASRGMRSRVCIQ